MITDTKTVVNMLVVILFLTMLVTSFNFIDFSYFLMMFFISFKFWK